MGKFQDAFVQKYGPEKATEVSANAKKAAKSADKLKKGADSPNGA